MIKMTKEERRKWINGDKTIYPVTEDDWLPIAVGWQNLDGSITVELNTELAPFQRLRLFPKKKDASPYAPDFSLRIKRSQFDAETGELLYESKKQDSY